MRCSLALICHWCELALSCVAHTEAAQTLYGLTLPDAKRCIHAGRLAPPHCTSHTTVQLFAQAS